MLIAENCKKVLANPNLGEAYMGNLIPLWKYKFEYNDSEFRIIYTFYTCCDEKQKEGQKCRFEVRNEDNEVIENDFDFSFCAGLVHFIWVKAREECNNLYDKAKYDKDYIKPSLLE